MIGSARMCSGLYLLQVDSSSRRQTHNAVCVESKSKTNKNIVSVDHSNKESAVML